MLSAIDSHMHGDILLKRDKNFPDIYYENNIGGIIWAYNSKIERIEEYEVYWDYLKKLAQNLSRDNAPFFYKIGIHPRTICKELQEKGTLPYNLCKSLEKHMVQKRCLGIGEIGLDGEDKTQESIFIEQLKWCSNYLPEEKKIGIHTPRNDKYNITQKTLNILQDYRKLHSQIVIDHVELYTLNLLQKTHFYIGITLQQGKSSPEDVVKIVEDNLYKIDKIFLNSDGGTRTSKPYIDFVMGNFLKKDIKERLLKDNVISFYNLRELIW